MPLILASTNGIAVTLVTFTLGGALLSRQSPTNRQRGLELMKQSRDVAARSNIPFLFPATDLWIARERARSGDRDAAIALAAKVVSELQQSGRLGFGVWGTGILVEALLERGTGQDLADAREHIDWLADLPGEGWAILDVTLLRLRALLARASGDDDTYRVYRERYRDMAESLGYEGHIAWARAMT